MSNQSLPKWVKPALEFGPIVIFFFVYIRLKDQVFTIGGTDYDGFIIVTACFIPLFLLSTGILWKLTGSLSKMQVLTAILITVFGGLSVWLNDDRFIKMKPTLLYLIFGGILGIGLLRGKSYLQSVVDEMMPMHPDGWMIFTRRLTIFFFVLAILNEIIWRGFSTETWVYFKTFGLSIAMLVFFLTQGRLFARYAIISKD